jgi:GTP-binding protein
MFVDQVEIDVKAGDGGNGAVSFRREKCVPRGGPNGGDGGRGGSIIIEIDLSLSTLLDFRYKSRYHADRGGDGQSKDMSGKNGQDLVLRVPPGTQVYDAKTGQLVVDMAPPVMHFVVAKGGGGGKGNSHFATAVRQTPRFAEKGEPGVTARLRLDLKLLADVGIIGFPSVGKSTLIAAVSAARPKIADYPFTTLVPNLGVVAVDDGRSFVMADMPGLIEGAHKGAGLGLRFLRHIERTRVLAHVLDVSGLTDRDPMEDYDVLNRELRAYDENLAEAPQIVTLNKVDVAGSEELVSRVTQELEARGCRVFCVSAATHQGLRPWLFALWEALQATPAPTPGVIPDDVAHFGPPETAHLKDWHVEKTGPDSWIVAGEALDRLTRRTDLENEYALVRLQRTMERLGVYRKLAQEGAADGDTVTIGGFEFEYIDEDAGR